MPIPELHDRFGGLDLNLLTPDAIAAAEMTEAETEVLGLIVEAVQAREASHERRRLDRERVREALRVEAIAYAENLVANPPMDRLTALRAAQNAYYGIRPEEPVAPQEEEENSEAPQADEASETTPQEEEDSEAPKKKKKKEKSGSHPKHAKARPAANLRAAQAVVADAQAALRASEAHALRCEKLESEALCELIRLSPPPSAEDVHRAMIAKEQARKLERIERGLPLEEPKPVVQYRSELDRQAAMRGKKGVHTPLQGNRR
jgi:hypothetical protein